MSKQPLASTDELTAVQVAEYLRTHPEFFKQNPELFNVIAPPERELGESVVDFQHFQLKNLQENSKQLQGKYEGLVDFCRDNLSVQSQVHSAVLRLIRARTLEQLLEVLTLDLVSLFDLDVVRLCVESEIAAPYDTYYSNEHYSGISFIAPGIADAALGNRQALLIADIEAQPVAGFDEIFAECEGLVHSCALLRLGLKEFPKGTLLAFGVRYKNRFHTGQAIDLLTFLASIVGHQLEGFLKDIEPPI